jgi:SUMO ligase MMS21 Smc5/6 complex component
MAKQEILNKLIDSHEERVIGVLKKLEDDIIADLTKSTAGGEKLTTQLAIQLRPNLKRLIEENYLSEVDNIIRSEYDEVIKEYQKFIKPLPIPVRFKSLTKPNLEVINQLKFLSFSGFEDIANTYLDTLANEVYQSAIVGKDFNQMVKNIRAKINGVYQRSDETEINNLVDFIDKNRYSNNPSIKAQVTTAKETLQSKYGSDVYGNNMRRYASQMAHDSLMQFDGQFTKYKANEAGITSYKYTGTNIITTRPFQ